MDRKSRLAWFRAVAFVCFLISFGAYSQKSDMSVTIDPEKKEILTYVRLSELPSGVDIIWQQKIPKGAMFSSSSSNQNPEGKMMVLSFSKHLHASTMSFSFVCKLDSVGEEIFWGESAVVYTDAESKEQVINFPAKTFVVAECLSNQEKRTGKTEEIAEASSQNTIVVEVIPKIDEDKIENNDENSVADSGETAETEQTVEEVIENQGVAVAEIQEEVQEIQEVQEEIQEVQEIQEEVQEIQEEFQEIQEEFQEVQEEFQEIQEEFQEVQEEFQEVPEEVAQKMKEKFQEMREKIQKMKEEQVQETKEEAQETENPAPSLEGKYYIQLFALKNKRTISDVKKLASVLEEDSVVETQRGDLFVYLIGGFLSKEEADGKLEYYKKYTPDAFIKKL
ncbi:MAG: SPOR domain-containing protein [Lentimicrobiaceae bacterium]|nr:SPOR domain-containing protein [Lentimicrobiaceae bacterium]